MVFWPHMQAWFCPLNLQFRVYKFNITNEFNINNEFSFTNGASIIVEFNLTNEFSITNVPTTLATIIHNPITELKTKQHYGGLSIEFFIKVIHLRCLI